MYYIFVYLTDILRVNENSITIDVGIILDLCFNYFVKID